jgi:outer membrane autotransporter protein
LLSSASVAAIATVGTLASGGFDSAVAGCTSVNTTIISCDPSGITAVADPGTASLTVDSVNSTGVLYNLPTASIPGNYSQTLTVTGTTVLDTTGGQDNPAGGAGISVQEYGPAGGAGVVEQTSIFITDGVTIDSHARYGAGAWVWRRGAGDVLIDSAADVTVLGIHDDNTPFTDDEVNAGSAVDGISAMTHLGAATVINRGSVTAYSGRGLYVDANFAAATLDGDYNVVAATAPMATARIENAAGATVDSYLAGARAIAYYGLADISNAGSIHSDARQALVAWSAAGDASITNTGTATADDRNAIHAMTERGNVTILNSGTVTASKWASDSLGAPYGYSGLRGNADYTGYVWITNTATGSVTASYDAAVVAHTPVGNATVENLGTLYGLHGVFISNGSGLGPIDTIADTMATTGTAIDGMAVLLNGGKIIVTEYGAYLDGTTNSLVNTGTITTSGNIAVVAGDGDTTVLNSGKIAAGSASGVAIAMGSGANRLIISDTSEIVGKVTNESTGNMLELTGTGTGELDIGDVSNTGQYQGFANLTKTGSGLWILNGVGGSLTGTTTVDAGILELAFGASSTSVFAVNDGAVLRGTGTVGGLVVNAGGTVSPGSSPGTLAVNGDVAFAKGSTYVVDAGSAKNHDLIDATGAATIAGGAVQVVAGKGYSDHLSTYAILSADGGIAGQFDSATTNYAFLDPFLSYDPQNVYLTLARNDVSFASEADTANQKAAAAAAESLGYGDPVYDAVLGLTAGQAPGAFDALSGEAYASAVSIIAQDSLYLRQAVSARIWQGFAGGPASAGLDPGVSVWGQGYGAWGDIDGNGNAASVSRDTGGFFGGFDGTVANGIRLGVIGGYGQSSFDIADRASSGDIDTYNLGAYGGTRIGALGLFGAGAYGWNDVSISRTVAFPGYEGDNKASLDLGTTQFFGEANWRFEASPAGKETPFGKAWLEPFAAPAYVGVASGSFTESGSSSALTGSTDANDLFYLTLGARVGTAIVLANGAILTPRASLAWQHAFGDVDPSATLAFASGGMPFTVSGVPIAEDTALVGASLDYGFTEKLSANVAYSGQFGGGQYDNAVKGTLNVKF